MSRPEIRDGDLTKIVYTLIKEEEYAEAISILKDKLDSFPKSLAALSLLGHCHFQTQQFTDAAMYYGRLAELCPEKEEYQLYHAQSLYHANLYDAAMNATYQIEKPEVQPEAFKLQAAIKYASNDFQSAQAFVDKCPVEDPDTAVNRGCLLYKEGNYEDALQQFLSARRVRGYDPHIVYNIALCYYRLRNIPMAANHIAEIIEHEVEKHPEMSVGVAHEGFDLPSIGNTLALHGTALIETFNLKAALEFDLQNSKGARNALVDLPPRSESELDAVTLHNQAVLNMETDPNEGFEKLVFILSQDEFPPETFGNLLLLYFKYECYHQAADVMAQYAHLTSTHLTPFLYDFFDALITQQTCPAEAYRKFEQMVVRTADSLRKQTKKVQDATNRGDDEVSSQLCSEYEDILTRKYVPALMAQAKIFWDKENYAHLEKIFRNSLEFCQDVDVWKLNVAHVIFMQDNRFEEATRFYEGVVKKSLDNILDVSAIVLGNLCVSYIMTGRNEEAEHLMHKIEQEESKLGIRNPGQKLFHLCIVNIVIGTLYCAKGNHEFGISRIIKSLEPQTRKLGTDTWFYAKRCFMAMIEKGVKQISNMGDMGYDDCLQFLGRCERYGRKVRTVIEIEATSGTEAPSISSKKTVAYEARLLKALILRYIKK